MRVRLAKKRDFEGIKSIFEVAFTDEYAQREVDIVQRIEKIESFYPLVKALSLFPNPYQHVFTVHVAEDSDKIAGLCQMSPRNQNQTRWHIDNIAVHPDFRGQGMAQQLLNACFEYYNERGAMRYTLEVDTQNAPAIKLYEKLGFRRYSTLHYSKMPPKRLAKYKDMETVSVPVGMRARKLEDTEALLNLYKESIPPHIRVVEDRSAGDFNLGALQQGAEWLKKAMKRSETFHFVVEDTERNCLVASLDIFAQMRALPHVFQLTVHPSREELAEQLITFALNHVANISINPVLIGSFESQRAKRDAIKEAGFKRLTADFLLVRDTVETISLKSAAEIAQQQDGFLKPTINYESHPEI